MPTFSDSPHRTQRAPRSNTAELAETPSSAGVRELFLVLGALVLGFWVLSLASHSGADSAWSTSGANAAASGAGANWMGKTGAWIADLSFYVAGFSVWWLVLALARKLLSTLASWLRGTDDDSSGGKLLSGLAVVGLLASSSVLEWTRLHSLDPRLPGRAGGVLGDILGPFFLKFLGSTGSALVCIVLLVACAASVFAFSWGRIAQGIGRWIDEQIETRRERREVAQDQAAGQRAAQDRANESAHSIQPDWSADLSTEQAPTLPMARSPEKLGKSQITPPWDDPMDIDQAPISQSRATPKPAFAQAPQPLRIEPALYAVVPGSGLNELPSAITSASAPLPPSERVVKERQQPLFSDMPDSKLPMVSLLDAPPVWQESVSAETLEMTSRMIEKKLKDFGVEVRVLAASPGPVITRYEIEPATGVKGSQVVNLAKDLARSLSLVSIRVIETIPGKNFMALELPNAKRQTIRLSEILGSKTYHEAKSPLTMGLGKDIIGNPVVADLAKMPHCLVAGTTGSGKSVGINAMILSLLYKADAKDVRLLLIDPKMLEMSVYEGIPHLLAPVVIDMTKAAHGLNWCVNEMERRYRLMSKMGVRNLAGFNVKIDEAKSRGELIPNPFSLTPDEPEPLDRLPHIVVVIDELADLMMVIGKKIEDLITRITQKARAAGIHLILATQRPSVDVITGLIKANVPTRLSFQVSSKIDSRTILDQMGAEALLGMGDMLYLPVGAGIPVRVHGAFVSDDEVHRVVAYLKTQGEPNYIDGVLEGGEVEGIDGGTAGVGSGSGGESDQLYDRAVDIVLKNQKASISLVQRHLGIGYNKAANLLEAMEKAGLVSTMNARGAREILTPNRGE